jgi:hypothetical protein
MGSHLYATFRKVRENMNREDFSLSTEAGILKKYCATNSGFPEVELRFRRVERVLGFFSSRLN